METLARIDRALEQWDEEEAEALLHAEIEQGSSSRNALVSRARTIDRNDLAIALLSTGSPDPLTVLSLEKEMGEAVADRIAALDDPREMALLELVSALEMEGRAGEAIALLDERLATKPDWLEGHQTITQLRWMARDLPAARSFEAAIAAHPEDEVLRAAWLGALKSMGEEETLTKGWAETIESFSNSPLIAMVGADLLSELGRFDEADRQFARLAKMDNRQFDGARMRHLMRTARFEHVLSWGAQVLPKHDDGECWAWFGAALRALDHPQADWFFRGETLVGQHKLELDEEERVALAAKLRALHHSAGPPFGQSPRGGTQTFGNLFKRRDHEIVTVRRAIRKAVRAHVEALPPLEPQHPFLARRDKGAVRMEGSWSILLKGGGHHVPHIHSHGWLSSALYVDLPEALGDENDPKGWLQVGQPLIDGGEAIDPIALVRPEPLKLALFPSIFWHGTLPFDEGERLTIAFDMVPFRQ